MAVHLQGVIVRQYQGAQRRFELRAARMQVREQSERLDAQGGVQGVLESALWKERE